jgi:hypothetical protein
LWQKRIITSEAHSDASKIRMALIC